MKHLFIDVFLNGEEIIGKGGRGVCSKCGRYAPVFSGRFGVRVCKRCIKRLETDG